MLIDAAVFIFIAGMFLLTILAGVGLFFKAVMKPKAWVEAARRLGLGHEGKNDHKVSIRGTYRGYRLQGGCFSELTTGNRSEYWYHASAEVPLSEAWQDIHVKRIEHISDDPSPFYRAFEVTGPESEADRLLARREVREALLQLRNVGDVSIAAGLGPVKSAW